MLKCLCRFDEELDHYSLKLILCCMKQIDELQVIMGFVQAAKRLKTVCKWDEMKREMIFEKFKCLC